MDLLPTFNVSYALFDPKNPLNGIPLPGNMGPVATDPELAWRDAGWRLDGEMNDKATGRSGDIVLLMNTNRGAVCVVESDILPGWHGAPTKAESEVPMLWHYSGGAGIDADHRSDLLEIVQAQINAAKGSGALRTRHFKDALLATLSAVRSNAVNTSP